MSRGQWPKHILAIGNRLLSKVQSSLLTYQQRKWPQGRKQVRSPEGGPYQVNYFRYIGIYQWHLLERVAVRVYIFLIRGSSPSCFSGGFCFLDSFDDQHDFATNNSMLLDSCLNEWFPRCLIIQTSGLCYSKS